MSPRPKRQIRTIPALTNQSESEIRFLFALLVFQTCPALGIEFEGIVPVFGVDGADAGSTHEEVAGGDDIVCPWDGEIGYDFSDEGVEGWMEAEDFFDYVVEEGEVFEVVVLKGFVSENAFLFLI